MLVVALVHRGVDLAGLRAQLGLLAIGESHVAPIVRAGGQGRDEALWNTVEFAVFEGVGFNYMQRRPRKIKKPAVARHAPLIGRNLLPGGQLREPPGGDVQQIPLVPP